MDQQYLTNAGQIRQMEDDQRRKVSGRRLKQQQIFKQQQYETEKKYDNGGLSLNRSIEPQKFQQLYLARAQSARPDLRYYGQNQDQQQMQQDNQFCRPTTSSIGSRTYLSRNSLQSNKENFFEQVDVKLNMVSQVKDLDEFDDKLEEVLKHRRIISQQRRAQSAQLPTTQNSDKVIIDFKNSTINQDELNGIYQNKQKDITNNQVQDNIGSQNYLINQFTDKSKVTDIYDHSVGKNESGQTLNNSKNQQAFDIPKLYRTTSDESQ